MHIRLGSKLVASSRPLIHLWQSNWVQTVGKSTFYNIGAKVHAPSKFFGLVHVKELAITYLKIGLIFLWPPVINQSQVIPYSREKYSQGVCMAHSTLNGHHISHMKVQPRMPLLKIVTKSTRKKSQGNYIMCIYVLYVLQLSVGSIAVVELMMVWRAAAATVAWLMEFWFSSVAENWQKHRRSTAFCGWQMKQRACHLGGNNQCIRQRGESERKRTFLSLSEEPPLLLTSQCVLDREGTNYHDTNMLPES